MPANLENSAVATGLVKVSFHSNPKERQCQRIFKLLYNCSHFTCQQCNAQNPSRQASTVCEPRTSRFTSWVQKSQGTRYQIANICWIIGKAKVAFGSNASKTSASLTMLKPLTVWVTTNCGKFLRDGNTRPPYLPPEKSVCR